MIAGAAFVLLGAAGAVAGAGAVAAAGASAGAAVGTAAADTPEDRHATAASIATVAGRPELGGARFLDFRDFSGRSLMV